MAEFEWVDIVDGETEINGEAINDMAAKVKENETNIKNSPKKLSDLEDDSDDYPIAFSYTSFLSDRADSDGNGDYFPEIYAKKTEVESAIGDVETALDIIIAIQNSLIGGESV